jgi:cardiolipin synthase
VTVRNLVDAWGTPKFRRVLMKPLVGSGVHVAAFLPSRLYPLRAPRLNFVNHRKIITVDERIAFTGGMNIGNEYADRWRDLMVRIEGPAVHALEHVFLDDWFFATKQNVQHLAGPHSGEGAIACAVIASGPDREAWIEDAYFIAVTRAEKRVWIVTPYFIPSVPLMKALRTAADRGVDVRILLPSLSDVIIVKWASRSYYPDLLQTGVRIYEHKDQMIHAKALIVDDHLSSIGSANIDARSFRLSFEVGCLFHDETINARLAEWFESLAAHSTLMKLDVFEDRSTFQKTLESAAHLLSPLL